MNDYAILAPIVLLFVLGAVIALRSGVGATAAEAGVSNSGVRLVVGNFSALLLRVAGFLVVLMGLQSFVGFPKIFLW